MQKVRYISGMLIFFCYVVTFLVIWQPNAGKTYCRLTVAHNLIGLSAYRGTRGWVGGRKGGEGEGWERERD